MDFQLSTEQALLRQRARAFARQTVAPLAAQYDREAIFPWEIFHQACEKGLLHLQIPSTHHGKGLGIVEMAIVSEELAWGCSGICAAISLNALAVSALLIAGSPSQQSLYLHRLLSGDLCSFALTESEAGSDAAALQSTAIRENDSYVLNGRKIWISNAPEASFFLVFAKTDPGEGQHGVSAFIVERDTPGLTIGPSLSMLGQRATPVAEVRFEDVRLPLPSLLGEKGKGFRLAMQVFDHSRPMVAAYGVGIAQRCLDETLAYACQRHSMGKPIIEHQAIGQKIAEIGMRLEAARLLTYQAASMRDAGQRNTLYAAYATTFSADTAVWATAETVQIFGGKGYSTDLPIEKLYRDAKLLQIYEGTGEIQRAIMQKELLRP